ncbi:MAG: RHS repeat protein [Acidobacteriia bacterium]|nr:RHS repeat protein [Terriglobia bacterium]
MCAHENYLANGRYINLAYDAQKRITQATDISGRTVGYTYDLAGRLSDHRSLCGDWLRVGSVRGRFRVGSSSHC